MKIETLCMSPIVEVVDNASDAKLARRFIALGMPALQRARIIDEKGERVISDMCTIPRRYFPNGIIP